MAGSRRRFWIGFACVAVVISTVVGAAAWVLAPSTLKPRLIAAANRATGRSMTISGRVGIKLSLTPTIWMEDVALANPPGFSRPDIVTVDRVELGLRLLPLLGHRFEVDHVTLVRPDLLLETDAAGHGNWTFARPPVKAAEQPNVAPVSGPVIAPIASGPAAPREAPVVSPPRRTPSLMNISVVDGRIGWINPLGHQSVVGVERLVVTETPGQRTGMSGTISYAGRLFQVTARTGSVEDLRTATAAAPWPVMVKLQSGDASLTLTGSIAQPLRGRGYLFTIDADLPDPPAFAALLPRLPLASLGAVSAHAELRDDGGPGPSIAALRVKVGAIDLGKVSTGARLEDATLSAAGGSPLTLSGRLNLAGAESGITGTIGDLGWLGGGAVAPVAVDLAWNGASARASVKGVIQAPRRMTGVALDVAAIVPDPSLAFGGAPPLLKSVTLRARMTDAPAQMPFQLTSNAGDLEGALLVTWWPRVAVEGTIWSQHLDLDLLRGVRSGIAFAPADAVVARQPGPVAEAPASGPSEVERRSSNGGSGGRGDAPVPGQAHKVASREPLIPDTKLPFGLLRLADGAIRFNFGHVLFDGADIRRIDGAAAIKDGVLRLDPLTIAAINQRLTGTLLVDAARTPASVQLSVDAPGLALQPLLAAFGLPAAASGGVALRAELSGEGDTPRALAASLNGWAGAAVENGQVDTQLLNSLLIPLRPLHVGGPDVMSLRCFAARADVKSGVVTIQPMALSTEALIIEGNGNVDLGHETMSLRLRPRTKLGGTGIALPVRVSGPLRDPSARIDISPGGGGGGALAGLLLGGKDVMGAAGGGDPCPDALARARLGAVEGQK